MNLARRAAGFTLVELLIAFSLIALISLLLFSGLRLGMRAWEGVDRTAEQTAELRVARNFLERALAQARPVSITLDDEPVLVFSGDAQDLELVAPLSEYVGIPGLYILRLGLEDGESPRLMLTRWLLHPDVLEGTAEIPEWTPYDGGIGSSVSGTEDKDIAAGAFGTTVLAEGVDELAIEYFGPDDDAELVVEDELPNGNWQDEWIERHTLPLAVRIRLTTTSRSWPDMLVRLPQTPDQ